MIEQANISDIKPGQLYHHWKGGRKAKIVLLATFDDPFDGTVPMVVYVHEGENASYSESLIASNPEYGQTGKPYPGVRNFKVQMLGDRIIADSSNRPADALFYIRTIANFTEDLGNGIKRFWLAE